MSSLFLFNSCVPLVTANGISFHAFYGPVEISKVALLTIDTFLWGGGIFECSVCMWTTNDVTAQDYIAIKESPRPVLLRV